jgi:L-ribulose-5-phosphate 4-epimerase
MSIYQNLKLRAYKANREIDRLGLVLYTFGNASAADRERGVFAIKPSGVPYNKLKVEDMVILDFDANIIEGDLRPSSDTKTHAVLYRHLEDIGGVAHTHSTYATAWAQTLTDIPILGTTHADHLTVDVPCTPPMSDEMIVGDYELQTGFQILNLLKERKLSYKEAEMVLVGNHAPFTWGASADIAVRNSAVLEQIAHMAYLSLQIRPDTPRLKQTIIKKHYERKHGRDAYYGQR